MANQHSDTPTLTGQSSPDQGPQIPSSVSLTDLFPPVPRAPPATPEVTVRPGHGNVFPPYIYINYEGFMRIADPFWEPERLATSCMYTFTNDNAGQVSCSERMEQWLAQLPDPEARQGRGCARILHRHRRRRQTRERQRPHALSSLGLGQAGRNNNGPQTTNSNTNMHMHGPSPAAASPTPVVAAAMPSLTTQPSLGHPNPLRQHAVRLEEIPVTFRIPKRKSSLHHTLRSSSARDNNHQNQQQSDTNTIVGDASYEQQLIQGVGSIQLGQPVEFRGSAARDGDDEQSDASTPQTQIRYDIEMTDAHLSALDDSRRTDATACRRNGAAKRKSIGAQVAQLFGGESHKKRPRSEVSKTISVEYLNSFELAERCARVPP